MNLIPSNYTKLLIQTEIDDGILLKRIQERDKGGTYSKKWEIFHNELRKQYFEKISYDECEHVLIYNQNNLNEILEFIKNKII